MEAWSYMHGRGEYGSGSKGWKILPLSALRPWQMVDFARLLLATLYVFVSFIFSVPRSWAEIGEHAVVLTMLVLAAVAAIQSSRSWVTAMRIRKPVIILNALLFFTLLVLTDPSNSPYFPGSFFVAIEVALVVPRRFHLLLAIGVAAAALGAKWIDDMAEVPAETGMERLALQVCFLAVAVLMTGMLLGPRRETLLEREQARRLSGGDLPPPGSDPRAFLLQALKVAAGGERFAVLFRTASHEPLRFGSSLDQEPPTAQEVLISVDTGWHDCVRDASIVLSSDGLAQLGHLSAGGFAWARLLKADTVLTVRVTIGVFEAVGAVHVDDPCHEDDVAIAQRVFESACEELMVRNSLDLAHVIAGARERERLQRELHDSVLQALASIRYQVAPLLSGRPVPSQPVVENIDRIAKDQIATIRWIIHPESDDEDFAYLPETLRMVVRSLGEQWGIACDLKVRGGNCATSAMIGRELGFAVREIVANAVRHAHASAIDFVLEPDGNHIALQVGDNGVPNMARLGSSETVHSRSLMRRIQTLGGEVFLRNIGGRTTIRITVPRK